MTKHFQRSGYAIGAAVRHPGPINRPCSDEQELVVQNEILKIRYRSGTDTVQIRYRYGTVQYSVQMMLWVDGMVGTYSGYSASLGLGCKRRGLQGPGNSE